MRGLFSRNVFGESEMMVPLFERVEETDEGRFLVWSGLKSRIVDSGPEPEVFRWDEDGVKFIRKMSTPDLIALYNLLCVIGRMYQRMEWVGETFSSSKLTLSHREHKQVVCSLSNMILRRREKAKSLPVIEVRLDQQEMTQSNVHAEGYKMLYCALSVKEFDVVNVIPPVDIPGVEIVRKVDPERVSVFLGNYNDAMNAMVAHPTMKIVYLGVEKLPGTSCHALGIQMLSWYGVRIDKKKLPSRLKMSPFIYKDWVKPGDYVVDEVMAAEVLAVHSFLAAEINVCTLSTNPDLIQAIETIDVKAPLKHMTYVFKDKVRVGYANYVSISGGKLHPWMDGCWDDRKEPLKVLQYSFTTLPGPSEGIGIVREIRKKKRRFFFYALRSGQIHVRSSGFTGYRHINVYSVEVLGFGQNWDKLPDEDIEDYMVWK